VFQLNTGKNIKLCGPKYSDTKYDLGRATHFFHKMHLKDKEPVNRKQYKIPDAHKPFLEENITDWLKLGVIQRSQLLYNSPVFCVPKRIGISELCKISEN
jgi:hypothetical protein